MSMLVDPSMIVQSSAEGRLRLEVDGATHDIEIGGGFKSAAGTELLLFGPDKHAQGGVLAQLARVAATGHCPALGGRVMLRVSFFKPSGGTLGDGSEASFEALRFPGELHLDANFEVLTPRGVLYAANPVHLSGTLKDLQATGSELRMDGADAPLLTADGAPRGRLSDVTLLLKEALVGREALLTAG